MAATFTPLPNPADTPSAPPPRKATVAVTPLPTPAALDASQTDSRKPAFPNLTALPSWSVYAELEPADFPSCWPKPLSVLPAAETGTPPPFTPVPSLIPGENPDPAPSLDPSLEEAAASLPEDYTDADLFRAFAPIMQAAVYNSLGYREPKYDSDLEAMLRATVRRALAEYSPAKRPFRSPGAMDRFIWRMQALFSSRSYGDILFEKTHRFQVQEVFLLDADSLSLISYASTDPARHANPRRIPGTVHRISLQIRDKEETGKIRPRLELPGARIVINRSGKNTILSAILRGQPNDLILSDLDFTLRRIEERFREQLSAQGTPLLNELQPFLEDCLLIQAPASAA
ncbi:MAG: hypothetical protein QM627_06150 [Luteolibacter sp.]